MSILTLLPLSAALAQSPPQEGDTIYSTSMTDYPGQVIEGIGDTFQANGAYHMRVTATPSPGGNFPPQIQGYDMEPFALTWGRTDYPVADGQVSRTWMWGPDSFTPVVSEPYAESSGGQRAVTYFDKSRMEITDPNADRNSIWFVTNGLLVMELVTGRLQLGNNTFEEYAPALVNVAGDAGDPNGPTYETFGGLRDATPLPNGTTITQRVNRAGEVTDDTTLAGRGVTAAHFVPQTNHQVASVFWSFMNSSGTVWTPSGSSNAALFENPFFATGFPISEAYWATVQVGGTPQDVLMQCFERRCLTYTPENTPEWQVEAGNVGRHYFDWRYSGGGTLPVLMTGPATDFGTAISVSVETRMVSQSPDGSGCVMARVAQGFLTHYRLCLSGSGETRFIYAQPDPDVPGDMDFETIVQPEVRPGANPATEWNTLKIIAQGNQFWLFVNGVQIAVVSHDGPQNARVGAATENRDAGPAEFEFRNLTVRTIQ